VDLRSATRRDEHIAGALSTDGEGLVSVHAVNLSLCWSPIALPIFSAAVNGPTSVPPRRSLYRSLEERSRLQNHSEPEVVKLWKGADIVRWMSAALVPTDRPVRPT